MNLGLTKNGIEKRAQNKPNVLICRTCLLEKEDLDMKDIYEITNILKDIVPIQLVKKNGWPSKICSDCLMQANQAYEFRCMCIESDKILQERLLVQTRKEIVTSCSLNVDTEFGACAEQEKPSRQCVKQGREDYEVRVKEENEESGIYANEERFQIYIKQESHEFEEEIQICVKEEESQECVKEADESGICVNEEDCSEIGRKEEICILDDVNDESDIWSGNQKEIEFTDTPHKRKHSKELKCRYCKKRFENRKLYKAHVKKIHKQQKDSYTCKVCDKDFGYLGNLRRHQQLHGSKPYKHQCDKCDRSFTQSFNLKLHMLSHSGEKNYSCNICEKKFARNSGLQYHVKFQHETPPERKPYACECGISFGEKRFLIRHQNTVHSSERKFVCKWCKKGFKSAGNLCRHEKIHKGERSYVCDVCEEAFIEKRNLIRHMVVHSAESK